LHSEISLFAITRDHELTWTWKYLIWSIEATWRLANSHEIPRVYRIWEYVREGDDLQNWKELVALQNFNKSRGFPSPEVTFNELMAVREKECPGTTEWKVIGNAADSILYEWHAKPCPGQARAVRDSPNYFCLPGAASSFQNRTDHYCNDAVK
jgi:hypothetical protein